MKRPSWFKTLAILALPILVTAGPGAVGRAQESGITGKALEEAAEMIDREPFSGSEPTLQAPTALLFLFPEMLREYTEAQRTMAGHQETRRRPESIQDVVSSHELDIDIRQHFNVRLRLAKQKVAHLRDRFEGLEEDLSEEEEHLARVERAFRESGKQLRRWIERDFPDASSWPTWPRELPPEVRDTLDEQLERLVAHEEPAERAMALARLERSFNRLARDHAATRREARRVIAGERTLLKHGALHVFKEIGFQIAECLERNEDANVTSRRMIDITLGQTSGTGEPPGDPEGPDATTGGG